MPNHVQQQLRIFGENASKVIENIAGTTSAFDFNTVIPMPKELDIDTGSKGDFGLAAITGECDVYLSYPWVKQKGIHTLEQFKTYVDRDWPGALELGHKYLRNKRVFGHATWYGWCVENWGTKWNAYGVSEPEVISDRAMISFDTAWSPPFPVIARLSELYPYKTFVLDYIDEFGNFAGASTFAAGEGTHECREPAWSE